MRPRISSFLLALALCALLLPPSADAASKQGNGHPYYIMVDCTQCVVTVYGLDENGYYTVPVRAMVCSPGSPEHETPRLNCSIGRKHRWHLMVGDVYAQYISQFHGSCLFHSLCYEKPDSATLLPETYDQLGSPASHGCIRLQTEDAKWIYDNCDAGTAVTLFDGDELPALGKPEKMVDVLSGTDAPSWDPTDPSPENPWAALRTTDISLSTDFLRLTIGQVETLGVTRAPEETRYPCVMFRSEDTSVAVVDGAGRVHGVGVGRTELSVTCGEVERRCTVVVTREDLPFCDVREDDWFYDDVRYLYEKELIAGNDRCAYAPRNAILRGEAAQLFYNFAGKPAVDSGDGGAQRPWYADAMDWAELAGLAERGDAADTLSARELLALLRRYDLRCRPGAPDAVESAFAVETAGAPSEQSSAPVDGADAAWALSLGLLPEEGEPFLADGAVTRAQVAALLHRYCLAREL